MQKSSSESVSPEKGVLLEKIDFLMDYELLDGDDVYNVLSSAKNISLWISLFVISFIILAILIYKFLEKLYIK